MKFYFSFLALLLGLSLSAQVAEGEIIYELKRDIHRNIPEEMSSLKDRIPQFRTSNHVLLFSPEIALFKAKKKKEGEEAAPPPGRRRGMRWGGRSGDNQTFRDLTAGTSIESTDFFGKKFLIDGKTTDYKWKMTGETKQVGDYLCQKATYQDSTTNVFVWFTPMIPVSAGPQNYGGLPGMILYVDINEGETIITATEINPRALAETDIVKPTEGKSISRDEFNKLRKEKMEEMQEEMGGRGRMFFRGGE